MHDLLFSLGFLCLAILLLIFLLKRFRQPYLVAYILAGVLLGRHCLHVLSDSGDIAAIGSLGILLLMFFLGMEIDIPDRKSFLLKPILAQAIKTCLGIFISVLIGHTFDLNRGAVLLLTILLTFNSTAVVSELLRQNGDLHSEMSKTVLNILLLQDIMLAPVLTLFQFAGNHTVEIPKLLLSLAGCTLLFFLLRSIRYRNLYQIPFLREMERDHELQVFAGAAICLSFALLAATAGLGGPIGAFAASLYIGRTNAFSWLGATLQPFKVFFTALFFVGLGLLIDVPFVGAHLHNIGVITFIILILNSLLSGLVFRLLKYPWKIALPAGALLSQTGEFGLLACTLAHEARIINNAVFKGAVAVVILTLLLSTPWAIFCKKMTTRFANPFTSKKTIPWP